MEDNWFERSVKELEEEQKKEAQQKRNEYWDPEEHWWDWIYELDEEEADPNYWDPEEHWWDWIHDLDKPRKRPKRTYCDTAFQDDESEESSYKRTAASNNDDWEDVPEPEPYDTWEDDFDDNVWDIVSCGVDVDDAYTMAYEGLGTDAIDCTDDDYY